MTTDEKRPCVPDREFLQRVKGNIKHIDDPKVQRTVREIDDRLKRPPAKDSMTE